jgi:hypothetical protein
MPRTMLYDEVVFCLFLFYCAYCHWIWRLVLVLAHCPFIMISHVLFKVLVKLFFFRP